MTFSDKVLQWFDNHGRKDLPWQQDINPYRVWISEIMLQQTQVKTVIPYFKRFINSFPTVEVLADADEDTVLKHWSGLGYYARARNLHKTARLVNDELSGEFPNNSEALQALPGIGRSTAGAILSIASQQKQAILDGNVKRVLCRVYAIEGWAGKSAVLKKLWLIAEELLPDSRYADYTQAMMDLGATLCTRSKPSCESCPLKKECLAFKQGNQTDYPNKKPKKALPERQTIMLIIKNKDNEILMQKRPPVGIWGSLWCFPQFEKIEDANQWLQSSLGISSENSTKLSKLTHTFSHFRLHIQPLIIPYETTLMMGVMEKDESFWYNITTEFHGGLAAPVQQLLNLVKEDRNGKND